MYEPWYTNLEEYFQGRPWVLSDQTKSINDRTLFVKKQNSMPRRRLHSLLGMTWHTVSPNMLYHPLTIE